jgi:hypothetical protein
MKLGQSGIPAAWRSASWRIEREHSNLQLIFARSRDRRITAPLPRSARAVRRVTSNSSRFKRSTGRIFKDLTGRRPTLAICRPDCRALRQLESWCGGGHLTCPPLASPSVRRMSEAVPAVRGLSPIYAARVATSAGVSICLRGRPRFSGTTSSITSRRLTSR